MGRKLLTVREAMVALGLSNPNTIYSMLERGELNGFKLRKEYRIEAASVEEYLMRVKPLANPEDYLTVDDVAEELRFERITIYRMIEENELPAVKARKEWRIPKDAYREWLMKHYLVA